MSEIFTAPGRVLFLTSSRFGQGNPRLGEMLMKDFLTSLPENKYVPSAIILVNSAVVLACSQSELHPLVAAIEQAGVKVLVNEESLSFYSMESSLQAGQPCSAQKMSDCLLAAESVITL